MRTLAATLVLLLSGASSAQPVPGEDARVMETRRMSPALTRVEFGARPITAAVLGAAAAEATLSGAPLDAPNDSVVFARTALPVRVIAQDRLALPYEVAAISSQGPARTSHLVVAIANGGMRLSSEQRFETRLLLLLEDNASATERYPLPQPVQVIASANVDDVVPSALEIAETGRAYEVVLHATNPSEPVRATLRAGTDPAGVAIDISVARPKLHVAVTPPEIQGFGLETATVIVRAIGVPNPAGRQISLQSAGRLTRTTLELNAQGVAETTLRSEFVGASSVTAFDNQLDGAEAATRFKWPVPFLLAALLGGLAGAFLGRGRKPMRKALVAGAVTGLVAPALYAIGVNVTLIEPTVVTGEIVVFGIAAAGAFAGLKLPA